MPKPKKARVFVTSDNSVISLKSRSQPLTNHEMITLNKIYNETIMRLARTIELMDNLERYLSSKDGKDNLINIKQLIINENVDPDLLHTLKMIKRHFYIDVTHNSINNILSEINLLRDNILKTLKGLEGQLDFSLQILDGEPTADYINQNFKDKTYALIYRQGTFSLAYYEDKIKKLNICIDDVYTQLRSVTSYSDMCALESQILEKIMLYHAKHMRSKTNSVYISNIPLKDQQENKLVGYVESDANDVIFYGAIHIDYRLLNNQPSLALETLIHESFHRYAWVHDEAYYTGVKKMKNNNQLRPYPHKLQRDTYKAMDNADSYAYYVCDMTGGASLYTNNNTPAWSNQAKYTSMQKPLPGVPCTKKSPLSKLSIFGLSLGAAALFGGTAYYFSRKTPKV